MQQYKKCVIILIDVGDFIMRQPFDNINKQEKINLLKDLDVTHFNSTLTGVYYTLSFSTIKTHIQNGNPIQAAAGYYIGSTRCGGHVVVIKGVYFASATSTKYIQYVDPANGNTYSCTYTAFCNGSYNGRKYDQTVFVN